MINLTPEIKDVLNELNNNCTDTLTRELDSLVWEQLILDSSLPTREESENYYFSVIGEGWSVVLRGDPWNFFVNGRHYLSGNFRLNVAMYLIATNGIFGVPKKYRIIWKGVVLRDS